MKKNILFLSLPILVVLSMLYAGCVKNTGDYSYSNPKIPFNGTTYDYLKSQPGVFDSLLLVIDRLGLTNALKTEKITLFAPTNQSFKLAVDKLNNGKKANGGKLVFLNTYDATNLDSLMCRYLLPGIFPSDSMLTTDGITKATYKWAYPMNCKKTVARSEGVEGGGASSITFSDTRRSRFKTTWLSTTANAIDITTKNGIVHVLDPSHLFGFNDYFRANRSPWGGSIFNLPAVINNSVILEAENFDLGGQNIAYYSTTNKNTLGNYRPSEGINLSSHGGPAGTTNAPTTVQFPASYDIFQQSSGDWFIYTVNVPSEGDYYVQTRYRNRTATLSTSLSQYHWEVDFVNVSGPLTNVGKDAYAAWTFTNTTLHLKAGVHALKFFIEISGMEIDSYYITKLN
jgi:hypothetical protein